MKRRKMGYQESRRNFSRGSRTKSVNMRGTPMRGGIRL